MIVFLDPSALIKLYVAEAGSPDVQALVSTASAVAVCRIAWAEAMAAFARRTREVPADLPSDLPNLERARAQILGMAATSA